MEPGNGKKAIFIHVGLPKCGSTSLQKALTTRQAELVKAGILYPLPSGTWQSRDGLEKSHKSHTALSLDIKMASKKGRVCTAFRDTIDTFERSGARTMVLSSESFTGRYDRFRKHAIGDLSPYDVHLVMFFRRADRFALSLYKQAVKMTVSRSSLKFSDFVDNPPSRFRILMRFNLYEMVTRLAELFEAKAVHVISLDGPGGNTVKLMGDLVGFPLDAPLASDGERELKTVVRPSNVSLSDPASLFLAAFNARGSTPERFRRIQKVLARTPLDGIADNVSILSPALSKRLLDAAAAEFETLSRAFPGAVPVAEPIAADPSRDYRDWLTEEEFERILERVIEKAPKQMKLALGRPQRPAAAAA
jgi:hypothetical protein